MFNFNFALLNFIVGLAPAMEALMEAQEGLYSRAEVLETALLQVLEREGLSPRFYEVDKALQAARKELQRLEQEEEEAFLALLGVLSEVPAVSLAASSTKPRRRWKRPKRLFLVPPANEPGLTLAFLVGRQKRPSRSWKLRFLSSLGMTQCCLRQKSA